ncbi:hypothetical protein ASPFODRAFT_48116 [Aspergillus luchuensis CBS 106.47]|uniref:Uncharacterized protein n=1 Tax=Aspergillus luchuensis (strain CBS 106.47) TaxID=1137211 RepID=A0A1M3TFL9_ASPLC|nr:hypothetical protein ASPFODRAFT_48116 [Aspergillus luchuensis CBS 106.47]
MSRASGIGQAFIGRLERAHGMPCPKPSSLQTHCGLDVIASLAQNQQQDRKKVEEWKRRFEIYLVRSSC